MCYRQECLSSLTEFHVSVKKGAIIAQRRTMGPRRPQTESGLEDFFAFGAEFTEEVNLYGFDQSSI
jgi:hypothetical protein